MPRPAPPPPTCSIPAITCLRLSMGLSIFPYWQVSREKSPITASKMTAMITPFSAPILRQYYDTPCTSNSPWRASKHSSINDSTNLTSRTSPLYFTTILSSHTHALMAPRGPRRATCSYSAPDQRYKKSYKISFHIILLSATAIRY